MRKMKSAIQIVMVAVMAIFFLAVPAKALAADYPTMDDAEAYIRAQNLTSDLEIFTEIVKFCAENYDYNGSYYTASGMIKNGGGDCWASTDFIVQMCGRFDIQAQERNANREAGAGSGHKNAIAKIGDTYYIGDAGYTGTKPRYYSVREEAGGFWVNGSGVLIQYDGFDEDVIIPEKVGNITIKTIGLSPRNEYESGAISSGTDSNMKSIRIPKTVETIIPEAFWWSYNLNDIYVDEENQFYKSENGLLLSKDGKELVNVPKKRKIIDIPEGVEIIGEQVFMDSREIEEVIIPEGVTTIKKEAFYNCYINRIFLPKTITLIEEHAFYQTVNAPFLAIPDGAVIEGENTFAFLNDNHTVPGIGKIYTNSQPVKEYVENMEYYRDVWRYVDGKWGYTQERGDNPEVHPITTEYNGVDYSGIYNYFDYSYNHLDLWRECNGDPDVMIADWYENGGVYPEVTLEKVSNGVKISWSDVGAASYRIFRKSSDENSFKGIKKITGTDFTDKTVEPGKTYYYYVRCINGDGKYVGTYDVNGKPIEIPAEIKVDITLEKVAKGVKISWSAVDEAASYRVFRREEGETSFKGIKKITATEYIDKTAQAGKTYYYYVRCINGDGKYIGTYDVNGKSIDIPAEIKADIKLERVSKGVKISWDTVDGAVAYRVFRKASDEAAFMGIKKTVEIAYIDKGVVAGKTYTYYVRCIDANGKYVGTFDSNGKSIAY